MKKVAIYGRITKKENSGELDKQIDELKAYCEDKGYKVIGTIAECRRGRTISRELLMVVADFNNVDAVVVMDRSRICGDQAEGRRFEILANELGIEIECLAK